jgi:hypothetical protein
MTGKRYYVATREAWQKHAARFVNSHWIELASLGRGKSAAGGSDSAAAEPPARILVLVEGDEGAHLTLEDDPAFEALPHPLAAKGISDASHEVLASLGVSPKASTFDVAERASQVHPLLRHRVF